MTKTILVVEDRPDTRNTLELLFKKLGYVILSAQDGEKALKMIETHPRINLVITDIKMPKMRGIELLKIIRSKKKYDKVKVILITALRIGSDELSELKKIGANEVILKPFDIDDLKKEVEKQIGKS